MEKINCEGCGASTPGYEIIHFGSVEDGYRQLCSLCFNAEVVKRSGCEDFENIRLDPVTLLDCLGDAHTFHFQLRLLGNIVALDAFELHDGHPAGHEFQIVGDPADDAFSLLGRMIERIKRALSVRHIADTDDFGLQIVDDVVRGRIESDTITGESGPVLIIDGKEITWEEFGQMLTTFEGWQFKLEIFDRSEEA